MFDVYALHFKLCYILELQFYYILFCKAPWKDDVLSGYLKTLVENK